MSVILDGVNKAMPNPNLLQQQTKIYLRNKDQTVNKKTKSDSHFVNLSGNQNRGM